MNVQVQPGKYVVAVSGGVDSVSLLHALQAQPGIELVVAHFDHGIRPDSSADRRFVQALAKKYSLPFEYEEGQLGPRASEATARQARYAFLERVTDETQAAAVITAHHQDDVLETAVINMLRGTGRKGLSSLASRPKVRRPLLAISKKQILAYAHSHQLEWREDSTNQDPAYLRNYVRHRIMPRLNQTARRQLLGIIETSADTNHAIDTLLVKYLSTTPKKNVPRSRFAALPHDIARELLAVWLRQNGLRDFSSQTLERLVVAAKTGRPGRQFDIIKGANIRVTKGVLALEYLER